MKKTMFNSFLTIVAIFTLAILISCNSNGLTYPQPSNAKEFIVIEGGQKGFKVINIHTSETKNVPAVKELGGRMYQLFMSSMPTFNKKVVQGTFVPDTNYYLSFRDTIFKVTKHLRDTTIATVGI